MLNFRNLAFLGWLLLFPMSSFASSPLVSYPLIPHHVQQARRGLEEQERPASFDASIGRQTADATEADQVGAVYQGYGTHYVDLWCGSPPQRQTVIVDTGSGVTAFPCSECSKCGVAKYHIDDLFAERDSSTYQKSVCTSNEECAYRGGYCTDGDCKVTMQYSEGSRWDATMGLDRCYIGGPHEEPLIQEYSTDDPLDPKHASHYAFDMQFGCQTYLNGLFITQLADGIMGMNTATDSSYWSQLSKKLGTAKQFSLCFSRQPSYDKNGTEAGSLTLGGTDTRLHSTEMVYSKGADVGRERRWNVNIRKLYFRDGNAGESIEPSTGNYTMIPLDIKQEKINKGGVIVDSGSTDTYLMKKLAPVFKQAFLKLSGREYSNDGWSMTEKQVKALPTLILQLSSSKAENSGKDPFSIPGLAGNFDKDHPYDVLLAVPPTHYMEYKEKIGKYIARIYLTSSGHSTLGANVIMGHDVLFDVDNNRLGWAESSCDYSALIKDNGFDFPIAGKLKTAAEIERDSSFFEADPKDANRKIKESDDDGADFKPYGQTEDNKDKNTLIDCHEELIDRDQNITSPGRFRNETFVAMCKVKKGYSEFLDYCDTPECRIPVIVGLVIALITGMCFCRLLKCCCFYLFCCCFCKKDDPRAYDGVGTDEIELVNGGGGYRDQPVDEESYRDQPVDEDRKKDRRRFLGKKKKDTFKGDFKDFV